MTNDIEVETLAATHPTREQLEQFASGALESNQATWMEQHLSHCATCCQLLDSTPNNKLTELIRSSPSVHSKTKLRLVAGYQIESELGRGGMGVVYRAIQPALRRQVALKMIAQGVHAGQQELTRFRREAEAAAALSHPYIAQVYDVGEIDGQPYITMELVHGRTLSSQLSAGPLKFDDATCLLIKLCQAMQHAHANGIVHRDLKPQNILLENLGTDEALVPELRPKIVDFGLAKRIDSLATVTDTGIIVGTPSYMSPEQAVGNNHVVGPSTDVYSLGAVLYETLAGRPPFKGASPIETLTQVLTAEPAKPGMLRPGLPRDLETICLKCLEKSPTDRYLTATALLEDLNRFKAGHPILARPAGFTTRTWKWARRHPALAALVGVIVLASVGLVALGFVYNTYLQIALREARSEQVRADENFQFAFQAVDQMLDRVGFARLADTPEMEAVREQLLADAVAFYSKLLHSQPQGDIESRSQYYGALARLGKIQWTLGENEKALNSLQQAIEFQRQLSAEYPERVAIKHQLAISHINKGMVSEDAQEFQIAIDLLQPISASMPVCRRDLAQATNNLANLTDSIDTKERLHLSALHLREQLSQESPGDHTLQFGIGETQHNLGYIYKITGRIAAAEKAYRVAQQSFERLVGEHDSVTEYRNALAETINHLALLIHSDGRTDEAIALREQAIAIRRGLVARFPKIPNLREAVIRGLLNEAALQMEVSHFAQASQSSKEAVDEAARLVEEFPGTKYQFVEATSLTILATALSKEQKFAESKIAYERANVTYEQLLAAEPTNPQYMIEAGVQFMNFSNLLRLEAPNQAAEFNDRSTSLLEKAFAGYPERTDYQSYLFNAHGARASTYDLLGNHREAIVSWNRALQLSPQERSFQIGLLRALSLARAGEHTLATQACETLINDDRIGGADLYNLACIFGLADKAYAKSGAQVPSGPPIKECGDRAIELLNRADTIEFLRMPANRQQLMDDSDLESVRSHPAFQDLLHKL